MRYLSLIVLLFIFISCSKNSSDEVIVGNITIDSIYINSSKVISTITYNVDYDNTTIELFFNKRIDSTKFDKSLFYFSSITNIDYSFKFSQDSKSISITPTKKLTPLALYRFYIDIGANMGWTKTTSYSINFVTEID